MTVKTENRSVLSPVLKRINASRFADFRGTNLEFYIPMKKGLINFCFRTMITHSKGLKKRFNTISFESIEDGKVKIIVDAKQYPRRVIEGKIRNKIELNRSDEPILVIELKKGLNVIDKGVIETAKLVNKGAQKVKQGWKWLKNKLSGNNEPKQLQAPRSAYDVSPKEFKVNLKLALKESGLDHLNPIIRWERVDTKTEKIAIQFKIKIR